MPCNVFLARNSEVRLELQCFTAELITYIVCECDALEWLSLLAASCARLCPAGLSKCKDDNRQRFSYLLFNFATIFNTLLTCAHP